MLKLKDYINHFVKPSPEPDDIEHHVQHKLFCQNDYVPFGVDGMNESVLDESVEPHPENDKRLVVHAHGPGGIKGLVVPKHMWNGSKQLRGMDARNTERAKVYGSEHREPLTLGGIESSHKAHLAAHFAKPKHEQIAAEKGAIARLHAAGHLDSKDTTDEGEKTDTVKHEHDSQGRSFEAASSKGVAGHALYTSGSGTNSKHHVLNTCPGQTKGCGGGVDSKGVADTLKGTCFAPRAEAQYPAAAIRRATHEQAKHDPAMTNDWALAHTHSLRNRADSADKGNKRFLFRPNVVDETDRSSRHVIKHLNAQRATEKKPPIIANSYGKTNELHDPENGYHVTHSNIGPKVKQGAEVSENKARDKQRIRSTVTATEGNGKHIVNDEGHQTPPKNSYGVLNIKRGSEIDKSFQQHVTHAKYWSTGRAQHELSKEEQAQGPENHYDGSGKPTTPDKAHFGHKTVSGNRYDYQKQHVLHPRMVTVGKNEDGTPHSIPTDSRFKDNDYLPKDRFKSPNGKHAGAIMFTTPTTSTSSIQHHSAFTHHVDDATVEHAKHNGGEYEIDKPEHQEAAKGKEYVQPQAVVLKGIKLGKKKQ